MSCGDVGSRSDSSMAVEGGDLAVDSHNHDDDVEFHSILMAKEFTE